MPPSATRRTAATVSCSHPIRSPHGFLKLFPCTAYLTFVAKHVPPPAPTLLSSLAYNLNLATPPKPVRFQVPELQPQSTLETKRFLLAGRRRAHRMQRSKKSDALLAAFRAELFVIEAELNEGAHPAEDSEDNIAALQQEMIVEAWMRNDPDVHVEGEFVVASVEGFMEPVKVQLADVKKAAATRGHGGYRRLSLPSSEDVEAATGRKLHVGESGKRGAVDMETPLEMKDTLVLGLWIVRPQHGGSPRDRHRSPTLLTLPSRSQLEAGALWRHTHALDRRDELCGVSIFACSLPVSPLASALRSSAAAPVALSVPNTHTPHRTEHDASFPTRHGPRRPSTPSPSSRQSSPARSATSAPA